jgi:hypothetical protein
VYSRYFYIFVYDFCLLNDNDIIVSYQAIISFVTMQLQLCSVFFTFSLGTRTHYFGRTILHGGAKVFFLQFVLRNPSILSFLNKAICSIEQQEGDLLCNT